ncbi:hypothetical protein [Lysinibacillus telephonicus]|uniref:Uncharacterized protein n=1 Tax=Lysinibacillus telephonicus TaxID=1714840 RepID=A0A3S0KIF0_9BACI|nr:hypothetical protein [Lysinibacillus telephonicus]RTQ92245.1 hypothetical protein EKG35_12215 [Lysinibacillus telephonicus]
MKKVTLNNLEIQLFINMNEAQISKKGRQAVINKLTTMGMKNIQIEGKGKNASYTFDFPDRFGELLMLPKQRLPQYSMIEIECMDLLIKGNERDGLVMFFDELIKEIATKHGAEYEAVKTKIRRIKSHLMDCGLIQPNNKSHRVKVDDEWVTGKRAFAIHGEIKNVWKKTYIRQLEEYQQLYPNAESVPKWVFKSENQQLAISTIPRWFSVDCYKVAKGYVVDERLLSDIQYANDAILQTFNLDAVRNEISRRQKKYKEEKAADDEILAEMEKRNQEEGPSKADRKKILEQIKQMPKFD